MGSFDFFEETAPRKTAENTAKHCNGGVGSVVANHCGGGEISVVVTTLLINIPSTLCPKKGSTTILPLTLPKIDEFSKLFHEQTWQ